MGIIIGISGKIGSGKSTAAKYLIDNMPHLRFEEKFFAYNVKMIASIISGLPMEVMLSQEGKNMQLPLYDGITVGRLQQVIGTDLFRDHFDKMVWVKSMFAPYDRAKDNWIVSDVRFRNEADYVKQMGGILVRLEGDPAGVRSNSTRDMNHPSETELDDYDGFDVLVQTEPGEAKLRSLTAYMGVAIIHIERGRPREEILKYTVI
jgi:hypothetical protein